MGRQGAKRRRQDRAALGLAPAPQPKETAERRALKEGAAGGAGAGAGGKAKRRRGAPTPGGRGAHAVAAVAFAAHGGAGGREGRLVAPGRPGKAGKGGGGEGGGKSKGGLSSEVLDVADGEGEGTGGFAAAAGLQAARSALAADNAEWLFAWLLAPVPPAAFWSRYFERRPLLVRGRGALYLEGWLAKAEIDGWLRRPQGLQWRLNVDAVRFDEGRGEKVVYNGEPGTKAPAEEVWRLFEEEGCSLRVLHPQRWSDRLQTLLSALERHMNCAVGCNAYLTPAGAQGFAPHWDDIDAFVLQLEGTKRWHVYPERAAGQEKWPRESSADFQPAALPKPAVVDLHPGDVLYMPRGTIHEAACADPEGGHSLHVTVSSGHRTTWADFLQVALQGALATAAAEHSELRRCVPRDAFDHLGVVHCGGGGGGGEGGDSRRKQLLAQVSRMVRAVADATPVDSAADQLCSRFMAQRMPPPKLEDGGGANGEEAGGEGASFKVHSSSRLHAAFHGAGRLAVEGGEAVVYHPFANARLLHMEGGDDCPEAAANALAFPLGIAPAVEMALGATAEAPLLARDAVHACKEEAEKRDVLQALKALVESGVCELVADARVGD